MSGLRVEGLTTAVGGPYSFSVAAGECLAIAGPSGCGKTLLLRGIADLDPHAGEVHLANVACSELSGPEWRQRVCYLPAESLWWFDRVGEHFHCPDVALLSRLGFDEGVLATEVQRLSTGERQRLGLARLLQRSPEVLLLDEPTASLDPHATERVEQVVQDLQTRGTTVVWVSHDAGQAARVATRQCVFQGRELVEEVRP